MHDWSYPMSTDHHSESGAGAPTSAAATRTLGDRLRRYALEALVRRCTNAANICATFSRLARSSSTGSE